MIDGDRRGLPLDFVIGKFFIHLFLLLTSVGVLLIPSPSGLTSELSRFHFSSQKLRGIISNILALFIDGCKRSIGDIQSPQVSCLQRAPSPAKRQTDSLVNVLHGSDALF